MWQFAGTGAQISRSKPWLMTVALAVCLGGCVETLPQLQADALASPGGARIAALAGVSPAGATVAFVNLGGAPSPVGTRFGAAMSQALGTRNISTEETSKAHYLIRGHMSASAAPGGVALAYVWDIYDSSRRRRQRLEDEIVIGGNPADPWSAADDKALATIAGRSADEIAAFLTHMPEAASAAPSGSRPAAAQDQLAFSSAR